MGKIEENGPMKAEKIDKSQIEGLPKSAQIQRVSGKIYVFFSYCYNLDGKRYQERDYIGTVEGMKFVPNDYYIDHKPVRDHRPLKNWTNPKKAAIEREKAQVAEESSPEPLSEKAHEVDFKKDETFDLSAGASALMAKVFYETDMVKDVAAVLDKNTGLVASALNLAMHSAVTGDATYLASDESDLEKFIGRQCPTSQRASEVHQRLGKINGLDIEIGKRRCQRINPGELLALDGTRIDCNSNGICLSEKGKRKDGTFGRQINFSVLFNATAGDALCYRAFAGNINDSITLTDFRSLWKNYGIAETAPRVILDRGYFCEKELAKLDQDGIRFIVGAKTNLTPVQHIIDDRNYEFYEMDSLVRDRGCYGIFEDTKVPTPAGAANLRFHVFRSPVREMNETDSLLKKLDRLERAWPKEKLTAEEQNLLDFFIEPSPRKPLVRNKDLLREHCYTLGFFAFAANERRDCTSVLDDYAYRNEVEIFFKSQMRTFHSTRVHSNETLNGILFTTFIGSSATANILHRMRIKDSEGDCLRRSYSVPKLIKKLQKIHLVKDQQGQYYLTNVTAKEREIAEKLGFPGLFDSADEVAKLLSIKYLRQYLKN